MKSKYPIWLLVPVLCLLPLSLAQAQDEGNSDQLLSIHEDIVIPSKVAQYEKASKALVEHFAKFNVQGTTYFAANTDDFRYIFYTPVEDLAGVEALGAGWTELEEAMGEEALAELLSQFKGTFESHRNYIVQRRSDLSYNESYGLDPDDELHYRRWTYFYLHGGMMSDGVAISKEWKALYEKHGIEEGYRIYQGGYGSDGPLLGVVIAAKDAVDYQTRQAARVEKFGEEGAALWARTLEVTRKIEVREGGIRPDLSYQPTAAAATNQ